tara:strand:- start:12662 stop:13255 length:594 start_codon:yes stop_codon:yes gene_type:complete
MSAFYDRMGATALRLIDRFGQTITLRNPTEGSYDPVTGTTTPGLPDDQPAQAILKDYSLQQSGASYAEGTEIRQGDKEITIAASGVSKPLMTTVVIVSRLVGTVVIEGEEIPVSPEETLDERITELTAEALSGSAAPGADIQVVDVEDFVVASGVADANGLWSFAPNPLTGKSWTIVNIKEINPAGTALVYKVQGRR